jgi:[ribosomal protein S5]-alanine N-acetyltransferase
MELIHTGRIELHAASSLLAGAELSGRHELARVLQVEVCREWPPEALRAVLPYYLKRALINPELEGWYLWYAVDIASYTLCGALSFGGPPDDRGVVFIGYSVLPEFQRKGFASQMVPALTRWARSQPHVCGVEAEVYRDNIPSIRVLLKSGFIKIGHGEETGMLRYRHHKNRSIAY